MGERLVKAREAAGMSQRALAERVGVSYGAIAMYELGQRRPRGPVLVAMARVLGVAAEDLIDEVAVPPASGE